MSEHRQDVSLPREHDPRALSEAQLRHLCDEEEIERFLSLFSVYVTEVRLPTGVSGAGSSESYTVDTPDTATGRTSIPRLADRSLSEHVAYSYLLPHIPPAAGTTPTFTLKRLSLTIQRLYLASFPPYSAFLLNLAQLALWSDYQRSLRYCIAYWFLWFHDLLLPALVFRIVFCLLRRRLPTCPTLEELRECRQEAAQALEFGEAVQQLLSVKALGPVELWRLFRLYKSKGENKSEPVSEVAVEADEESLKRDVLYALNELADFHERIKNIFTWRRPDVSRRCMLILVAVGLGTLVLPARYIVKLVYWLGGILFWHVTPIVAALPRGDGVRLLSLFLGDAPTDADHAMELIAGRIAVGQDVDMASLSNQSRRTCNATTTTDNLASTLYPIQPSVGDGISHKKWGKRVARGKALLEEGRQLLSAHTSRNSDSRETSSHLRTEDGHTFLAQHASCPGLITLTSSTLFFTPLTGTRAKLTMPRDRLRGVRKSGLMKGITITWTPEELMDGEEREERFHWVGDRDELLARLVGSGGRRWITV